MIQKLAILMNDSDSFSHLGHTIPVQPACVLIKQVHLAGIWPKL